jgi:hypothetical protein
MRSVNQRQSEILWVTAPASVRIFFIAQPHRPVGITQYPGANRGKKTGQSFGVLVEDVCQMAMLLVVVEVHHAISVLQNLGELAQPIVLISP